MVSIERLVKIYNDFGDRENLSPLCSADEMLFDDNLTIKQRTWIERFISVWDYTQEKEYEQWQKKKNLMK
tara:strand:+ start:545 stop:754 length:210 start_codon:yes stop_codon:yes gene_type:complete